MIDSFPINQSKAITIHSHLTDFGLNFLCQFKKRPRWLPAMSYIMKQLMTNGERLPINHKKQVLIFENEVLQVSRNIDGLQFNHFSLWKHYENKNHQLKAIKTLLESNDDKSVFDYVIVRDQTPAGPSDILNHIATTFPQKIKTVSYRYHKSKLAFIRKVSVNYLLVATLLCLSGFAFFCGMQLSTLRERQSFLSRSIQETQTKTDKIESMARIEREYYRISSLIEAANESGINPMVFFEKLNSILPESVWVSALEITEQHITIDLFDVQKTDLVPLIEKLSSHFGKTNLELNEESTLQNQKIRRYRFSINSNNNYAPHH